MRNPSTESNDRVAQPLDAPAADWGRRNAADFSSLLLELARAQRGYFFYSETDRRRRPLAERAHRALLSELNRAGAIEFSLDGAIFRLADTGISVEPTGALVGFVEALRSHGLQRIRIDPTLTPTALGGFLDLLGRGSDRYPSPEHFARTLAARDSQGICINDIDTEGPAKAPKLSGTPPRASASLASELLSESGAQSFSGGSDEEKPSLEDSPLASPSADDRGERLRARLIELDATLEDDEYCERVSNILTWSEDLWNDELIDESYRAMLVLADHAVGHGGRTEVQARAAATGFASLASGEQLDDLIDRATRAGSSEGAGAGVRAAQLLLQLGARAVPAILDRLSAEDDPDRAAPLRALILTQGETALPQILAAIDGHDEQRARLGIRLAGELQNPMVLPTLIKTLRVPDLSRRIETIRALSLLPGEQSKEALSKALSSDLEEIAAAASEALATTDGSEAVPTLLDVLEATLQTTRTKLARTLVEVLGRIGDERAVPRLCALLERRPVLRRAHWHAIQLAAVDALAILPTKEARRCLERAARNAPGPIRDRARSVLESRSEEA